MGDLSDEHDEEATPDGPGKPTPEELAAADEPVHGTAGLPDEVREGDASEGDDEPD